MDKEGHGKPSAVMNSVFAYIVFWFLLNVTSLHAHNTYIILSDINIVPGQTHYISMLKHWWIGLHAYILRVNS